MYDDGTHFYQMGYELDWLGMMDFGDANIAEAKSIIALIAANGFSEAIMNAYAYDTGWKVGRTSSFDFGPPAEIPWVGGRAAPCRGRTINRVARRCAMWKKLRMSQMAVVERSVRLAVRQNGSLRLGVVADTHSAPHPGTHEHLKALVPDAILHAGDIGDLTVLDGFASIAPVLAVRGNIDVRAAELPDVLHVHVETGDASKLQIMLTHIAVNGPRLRADARRLAQKNHASLVVCGHSHVPFMAREGDVSIFNPGSAGPRRFHLPILFGTIDVTPEAVHLTHFECATGRRWAPRKA